MSKDIRHRLTLYFVGDEMPLMIEVDDIEYKDMLRSMRATDDPKSIWVRSLGTGYGMYNMSLVKRFYSSEIEED